jgi:methionyl-tRNA formyltransferase
MKLRVVFAGTPVFASITLDALISRGFNVIAVYSQPDRPAGRGLKLSASPVKQVAEKHGIAVKQPLTLKDPVAQAELAALKPDLMIVAAYGLILPQAALDIPRLGCLNIHASLLPRWRGAAPIHRAILAGDTKTGVAIMRMEAGLDTGPVLREKATAISADDTTQSLHDRLAALGASAMIDVLDTLERGESISEIAQPSEGVTYAQKISADEAMIDWSNPAAQIERAVRAFNPAPGAAAMFRGERIKLWRARLAQLVDRAPLSSLEPGTLLRNGSEALAVVCGDSASTGLVLALDEIQRPGGKRGSVDAWLSSAAAPRHGDRFEK